MSSALSFREPLADLGRAPTPPFYLSSGSPCMPQVFFDKIATIAKTVELIKEAAAGGAKLVVFPELWLPGEQGTGKGAGV